MTAIFDFESVCKVKALSQTLEEHLWTNLVTSM